MMALIVMSCSKDETTMSIPQESNAIEFGTYVGRDAQTRTTMINDVAALQPKGFGVFAYYTNDSDYNSSSSTPNFMYNQKVEGAVAGDGTAESPYVYTWSYTPVKYWPNEVAGNEQYDKDKVSFFAYAPYSAASTTDALNNFTFTPANDAPGDPKIAYIVNTDVKKQEDLLWGVNNTVAESDAGYGFPFKDQQKQTVGGDIKFQFKHALARIGFNVLAMVDDLTTSKEIADGTDIVVTQVELIGKFYASGALNLNNTEANVPLWSDAAASADDGVRTFVLSSVADNFVNEGDFGTKDEGADQTHGQLVSKEIKPLNADDSYLMVIPQKFDGTTHPKIKIRVTYDVITADGKLDTKQSKVTNVITSDEFAFTFVGGNAYTFNLHLGMTSVKFSADVAAWTEVGTGTVVNVPINTPDPVVEP